MREFNSKMDVLKEYSKEFATMFEASFSLLFVINMRFWFHGEGFVTRYWRFLYILPAALIFTIRMTFDVCKLMMEGDVFKIAYYLPPFIVVIQGVLKAIILFPKTTQITNIIKELASLWRTTGLSAKQIGDRKKIVDKVNLCNKGTYWIAIIGTSQYLLSPLFEALFYKFILQQEPKLLLPVASSYPFDPTGDWVVYVFTYAFQSYGMFLSVLSYIGSELIMITLCGILSIEFTLLYEDLLLMKPVPKRNAYVDAESLCEQDSHRIEDYVKRHQKLISLSTQIDNVFNKMIFIDLLFVGGTTCFFRYAAQFSRGLMYMLSSYVGVVASLLYVLFLCYYGELLTEASLRIGEAAYESLWYKGEKQYQRVIYMIIKRSQKACYLTSLKYAPITLNMFTKVISTTWSYLSLMNSIYGKEE